MSIHITTVQYNFCNDGNGNVLSNKDGSSHVWLLSTWNMAAATEEQNFIYF